MKKKQVKKSQGKELSHRERLFADGILAGMTRKEAAEGAGYAPGNSAEVRANILMKRPSVKAYINARAQKLSDKTEITQEKVLREYARLAFYDPRKFYDANGTLKQITELDDDTASALSAFEVESTRFDNGKSDVTTVKVKMPDRRAALDSICRVMGWTSLGKKDPPLGGEVPTDTPDLSQLTIEELRVISIVKRKLNVERI